VPRGARLRGLPRNPGEDFLGNEARSAAAFCLGYELPQTGRKPSAILVTNATDGLQAFRYSRYEWVTVAGCAMDCGVYTPKPSMITFSSFVQLLKEQEAAATYDLSRFQELEPLVKRAAGIRDQARNAIQHHLAKDHAEPPRMMTSGSGS
jgi:hypothetical protein